MFHHLFLLLSIVAKGTTYIGIFPSTSEGRFIKVNQAMAEMYGYSSPEEMVEEIESIAAQIYVDPSVRVEFQRLIAEHGEVKDFVAQNRHKNGTIFWISIAPGSPLADHGLMAIRDGVALICISNPMIRPVEPLTCVVV